MNCELFINYSNNWHGDVCIFGAGDYGSTWVYKLLQDAGFSIIFYIDNYKAGGTCNGLPIYSLDYLKDCKDILCFISTRGNAERKMVNMVENIGLSNYYHFESDYAPVDFAIYLDQLGDANLNNKFQSVMNDENYLRIRFKYRMGYEPDLNNPKTYNEKLQWLKLNDRKPLYASLVDKYEVKKIVAEKIGQEHIVPLYGVWDSFEAIDFENLPNQFVLKCTHDSGGMVVCVDKNTFDYVDAKTKLEKALETNTYWADREWPYKNVIPRIIAEKYISTLGKADSVEYKITCLNGKVDFVTICRGIAHSSLEARTNDHYDIEFNRVPAYAFYKNSNIEWEKPKQWNELIQYAEILAKGIPTVRVDFYIIDDVVYFGEMTFFSWSGCIKFVPEKYDKILGDKLCLPQII